MWIIIVEVPMNTLQRTTSDSLEIYIWAQNAFKWFSGSSNLEKGVSFNMMRYDGIGSSMIVCKNGWGFSLADAFGERIRAPILTCLCIALRKDTIFHQFSRRIYLNPKSFLIGLTSSRRRSRSWRNSSACFFVSSLSCWREPMVFMIYCRMGASSPSSVSTPCLVFLMPSGYWFCAWVFWWFAGSVLPVPRWAPNVFAELKVGSLKVFSKIFPLLLPLLNF